MCEVSGSSVIRGNLFVMLTSWEEAVCSLSGIKKHPLMGGWFTTSSTANSISAIANGRCRVVVRWQQDSLWEVPLYSNI